MSNYDLAPSSDNGEDSKDSQPEPVFYSERSPNPSKSLVELFTSKEESSLPPQESDIPPTVALEKEMERERQFLAEKQKEAELRQTQAIERMQLMQKRELDQKQEPVSQDLEIDQDATSEKAFDRRHEVLDRQYPNAQIESRITAEPRAVENAPVSIARVISARSSKQSNPSIEDSEVELTNSSLSDSHAMYKKSLQAGFFIGLTVVVLGLIVYFIFK